MNKKTKALTAEQYKEIIQTICQLILSTQMQKRGKHQEEEQ